MRILRALAIAGVGALCVSCSSSSDRSEPTTRDTQESTSQETVNVTSASEAPPTDPALALATLNGELEALTDQLGDPAIAAAARAVLEDGGADPALRFAATYVWANVGDDPSVLVPLLADTDHSVVITAAIGIIAQGGIDGFAPLIAALTTTTPLAYYDTGEPEWSAATVALVQFTGVSTNGPPFDADAGQLLLSQQRWQSWLEQNRATLTFDAEIAQWSTA